MSARLAVVDDDPAFAEFMQVLLTGKGYEVAAYTSGSALLDALREGPTPQLVLLDVTMPDLDGLETLRAIRQIHPTGQVIMLSGRQAPATIVEAVRLGAADYVLKPGDPEGVGEATLEAAIRNALERESGGGSGRGPALLDLGRGHAAADGHDRAGRRQRHRRAHPRRERRWQGSHRA
jgi:DNA-binding response OmpR family regulator